MSRTNINSSIDDVVSQAKREVSVLETKKQTLISNLKELEITRDKLSQEIIDLTSKHEEKKNSCQNEIDAMMKDVQLKLSRANTRDAEALDKVSQANDTIKKYEDLIKSNEGKEKNLEVLTMEYQNKISKLNMIFKVIKEHLDI